MYVRLELGNVLIPYSGVPAFSLLGFGKWAVDG